MSLLGERLRQAREARGLAPLQVEIDTRIRASLIEALEHGDYENLPPEPFLRGLIRTYSAYLGVDSEEMLSLYNADVMPPLPAPMPRLSFLKSPIAAQPTAPPISIPEEPSAPMTPPAAAPVPKPAAVKLPSLRLPLSRPPALKPNLPPPPVPPETLASAGDSSAAPGSLAHFTRRPVPLPVIVLIGIAIVLLCLVIGLFAASQLAPMVTSLAGAQRTVTLTRTLATHTPTLQPGAGPTSVPTIAATAPPFATFPGNPSPTPKITPRRTLETFAGLNFDVEVTQTISIQVGIDGVMVLSGQMQPGTSRSWSAKDSLYVRVENPRGAILLFNGSNKWFAPRTYAERSLIERQWTLNDKGTPVSTAPIPPATLAPSAATTPPAAIPPTPTPTLTPFS
jgi:transcriptional regulator with XRE-family HTH domain